MPYYHPAVSAVGDPGLGKWLKKHAKIPRAIRKLQPGKMAPGLLSLVPGPIGAASRMLGSSCAGDPGFGDFFKGVGNVVKSGAQAIFGGRAAELEQKAAAFLRTPAGAAAAAGAAGVAAGGAAAFLARRGRVGATGRHRRIDPTNVHALRRSIRRLDGFEKLARKVIHFTHPARTGGVARFKRGRRKRA